MKYDRLLPEGGIKIHHWTRLSLYEYMDANDASEEVMQSITQGSSIEPEEIVSPTAHIFKGRSIGRRFRVYVSADSTLVGVMTFTEYLDNPHGYGKNDFVFEKFTFPEFRKTWIARLSSSDMLYYLFKSEIANRLYAYVVVKDKAQELEGIEKIDLGKTYCVNLNPQSESLYIQKYMKIEYLFDTERGHFGILELDGNVYREMDIQDYYFTSIKSLHPEKNVNKLKETIRNRKMQLDRIVRGETKETISTRTGKREGHIPHNIGDKGE